MLTRLPCRQRACGAGPGSLLRGGPRSGVVPDPSSGAGTDRTENLFERRGEDIKIGIETPDQIPDNKLEYFPIWNRDVLLCSFPGRFFYDPLHHAE
jgi:hypothetical protein